MIVIFRIVYNLLFPLAFLFFLPAMLWKLWRRPGYKKTYPERFGIFSQEQKARLAALKEPRIWMHSVSVGETQIAISMIKAFLKVQPDAQIVVSTTTTTGQEIARKGLPDSVVVVYMPLDYFFFIAHAFVLIRPKCLVIFETEIWPELVFQARNRGVNVLLANGRMSDKSSRGYHRFACLFAPMLKSFNTLCVQSQADKERYQRVCSAVTPLVTGNMKFDQSIPSGLDALNRDDFMGGTVSQLLVAASTHPGEEVWILRAYEKLRTTYPGLKLILVPRHAERGAEIELEIQKYAFAYQRRSVSKEAPTNTIDVLLADTTGEMLKWMTMADIVVMGKSLAGHDEGHNLIEPALLSKAIVTGNVLKNFRFVLNVLASEHALRTVGNEAELYDTLADLLGNPNLIADLGQRARRAIAQHEGATTRTIHELEKLI